MHQGPEAAANTNSCCIGVSGIGGFFFTFGGSLFVAGFAVTTPHLIPLAKTDETRPATFRTVFGESGRGSLVLR
jgi:hypothetical protein